MINRVSNMFGVKHTLPLRVGFTATNICIDRNKVLSPSWCHRYISKGVLVRPLIMASQIEATQGETEAPRTSQPAETSATGRTYSTPEGWTQVCSRLLPHCQNLNPQTFKLTNSWVFIILHHMYHRFSTEPSLISTPAHLSIQDLDRP